ncbi:hypothetical protein TNCV_4129141 [Trichonephila clavipes]|nr:hypothetical protein TNCV_4129141 [Trichonephila clavipes]
MNKTCFQNVEEWSEANITGNNSFQWYFLTLLQVNWADIENYVEFLSKEMLDIKIDDNNLFEVERRQSQPIVSLRSNHHRHPASSANLSPVVQSPCGKTRGCGRKEFRESLAHVCFFGEGFTAKMIVQMKSNRFTGSVELSGKFITRLTTVLLNSHLQGFASKACGRFVRALSQRTNLPN